MLRKVKVHKHLLYICGAFLYEVFLVFLLQNFLMMTLLSYVFLVKV